MLSSLLVFILKSVPRSMFDTNSKIDTINSKIGTIQS